MNMLEKRGLRGKEMAYIEDILNHAAFIIPLGRHFLNRIIKTKDQAIRLGQLTTIHSGSIDNYNICLHLLKRSNKRIFMNNIIDRRPTNIYILDSCPLGLVSMSIHGQAWRYHIPIQLQGIIPNNNLEYIA